MTKALLYELGKSISFGRLPLLGKVLWPMILAASDDQGRGLAEPDAVKWTVCPNVPELDPDNIPGLLEAMAHQEMIYIYPDSRNRLLYQVIRWWEFQKLQWAQRSQFEPPPGWVDRIRVQHGKDGPNESVNWDKPGGFLPLGEPADQQADQQPAPPLPPGAPPGAPPIATKQPNINQPNVNQEKARDAADGAPAAPSPPPICFDDWLTRIEQGPNRTAILVDGYQALFPGRDPPDYGRVGAFAKRVKGAGRAWQLLWQAAAARPAGDPIDYAEGIAKNGNGQRVAPDPPAASAYRCPYCGAAPCTCPPREAPPPDTRPKWDGWPGVVAQLQPFGREWKTHLRDSQAICADGGITVEVATQAAAKWLGGRPRERVEQYLALWHGPKLLQFAAKDATS